MGDRECNHAPITQWVGHADTNSEHTLLCPQRGWYLKLMRDEAATAPVTFACKGQVVPREGVLRLHGSQTPVDGGPSRTDLTCIPLHACV